jgi:hypothetical protein
MPYNEDFTHDPAVIEQHKWLVTIQWASQEDKMHEGLHQERTALCDQMVNEYRMYAPPVIIDDLTTSRRFEFQENAEFYVSSITALAKKYGCNLVSATVTQID